MELMAINRDDLPGFVDAIARDFELVAPVAKEFRHVFSRVEGFSGIALDYGSTLLPPKKYLLPQRETLFSYKTNGGVQLTDEPSVEKRVILGMHSCDINAVHLLDDILAEGMPDDRYLARRAGTFIIGMDCARPCHEGSFCWSMGSHGPRGGYDLFLADLGEVYAVMAGSDKAETLMGYGTFFPAGYAVKDRFYESQREKDARLPDAVGYDTTELPSLLAGAYDSILWDALEERCFDCGACTVVCPTCYCFDVVDEPALDKMSGVRYRRWDGCQMRGFAAVAGGGNFRAKRSDRIRHRIFRKGKYIKEKFGRFACVGCGRCGQACLADIDILDIFKQLKG